MTRPRHRSPWGEPTRGRAPDAPRSLGRGCTPRTSPVAVEPHDRRAVESDGVDAPAVGTDRDPVTALERVAVRTGAGPVVADACRASVGFRNGARGLISRERDDRLGRDDVDAAPVGADGHSV